VWVDALQAAAGEHAHELRFGQGEREVGAACGGIGDGVVEEYAVVRACPVSPVEVAPPRHARGGRAAHWWTALMLWLTEPW
jgi:hypothetical protein